MKKRLLQVQVPDKLFRQVGFIAAQAGVKRTDFLRKVLENCVSKFEKDRGREIDTTFSLDALRPAEDE